MISTPEPCLSAEPIPAPRVKVGILPLFSTWIYQCDNGPVHLNADLEQLARTLMADSKNSTRRTNFGGWHYAFDFFELKEPVVQEFRGQMEQHVQAFLNHFRPEERKKKDQFRLRGWINIKSALGGGEKAILDEAVAPQ